MTSNKRNSGFECKECGKKFRTIKAAEKATSVGCPKCGGCDIDLEDAPATYRVIGPKSFADKVSLQATFDPILAATPGQR